MRCLSLLRRRLPQTQHQSLQPFPARFLDIPHLDKDSTFCTFDQVTLGTLSTHLLNRAVIVEVATLLAFPRTSQRPIRANLHESSVQNFEHFEGNKSLKFICLIVQPGRMGSWSRSYSRACRRSPRSTLRRGSARRRSRS